jgi:hypothetical protein
MTRGTAWTSWTSVSGPRKPPRQLSNLSTPAPHPCSRRGGRDEQLKPPSDERGKRPKAVAAQLTRPPSFVHIGRHGRYGRKIPGHLRAPIPNPAVVLPPPWSLASVWGGTIGTVGTVGTVAPEQLSSPQPSRQHPSVPRHLAGRCRDVSDAPFGRSRMLQTLHRTLRTLWTLFPWRSI